MRSYIYIIILLLSVSALAQDAAITISYGQKSDYPVSFSFTQSAPEIAYNIPNPTFVKNMTVDVTLPCCSQYALWGACYWGFEYAYTCGTLNLCVKYDEETALECQTLQNKKTQTVSFNPNKVIQKATFINTGARNIPNADTAIQLSINKISLYGGGFAQIVRSLQSLRSDQAILLGLVKERIDVSQYQGNVNIATNDPKAVAWFNEQTGLSATNRITTPNYDDQILACLNSVQDTGDANAPRCDYEDEQLCQGQGKDWYNGYCCRNAPFNPEAETPPSECTWYGTKESKTMNAVCGKNADGIWKWAAIDDVGLINILSGSCPSMQVVSDGTTFYTCSTGAQNVIPTNLVQPLNGKITILEHEYFCQGENIIECGGETPYSPTAKATGTAAAFNNQKNYCTTKGKWVTSLDVAGSESCVAAGLRWTGTKCCGETDDPLKTYEDPYTGQGTAGACYNNNFVASGNFFAGGKSVINYRGKFVVCDPALQPGTNAPTTSQIFSGTGITPIAYGPCGTPLQQAILTGTLQHIICKPSGEWQFTSKTDPHLIKQTLWQPSETEDKQGCCVENQCWDGLQCRDTGYYYDKIIGKGYRCE